MAAGVFRSGVPGGEVRQDYDTDEQAIEAALAELTTVTRVVLADGRAMDRDELVRLAAAAREPQ